MDALHSLGPDPRIVAALATAGPIGTPEARADRPTKRHGLVRRLRYALAVAWWAPEAPPQPPVLRDYPYAAERA